MSINKLLRAASKINVAQLLGECIDETKNVAIDLVRSQLLNGESGSGKMPDYASKKYKSKKMALNPSAGGRVDLKLTGAFQDKFYLVRGKYSMRIRSRDTKNSKLLNEYGIDIFQLNVQNEDTYVRNYLLKLMQQKIKNGLFK